MVGKYYIRELEYKTLNTEMEGVKCQISSGWDSSFSIFKIPYAITKQPRVPLLLLALFSCIYCNIKNIDWMGVNRPQGPILIFLVP